MKVKILSILTVTAFAFALGMSVTTLAAPKTPAAAVPATPQPTAEPAAEPHPEIRMAIGSLRRAKMHLEEAAHDFGGHKVEAMKATDEAIHQLELCLKCDKD